MESKYGRDPRRRLTLEETRELYDRADGRCQREGCGAELGVSWHAAHLTAHTNGGATSLANEEAWCVPCNLRLGPRDMWTPPLELRAWQEEALPRILTELYTTGRATLHAVPGAGKTIFGGLVIQRLMDVGLIDRVLVVTFNRVLTRQWKRALADNLAIHIDDNPHLGVHEIPGTIGAVITYANMANAAQHHRKVLLSRSTLVIFDEVHHLADKRSWGRAAQAMTLDDQGNLAATILNTTGTLFRSNREQIPTVRYIETEDERGRPALEAFADHSVTADQLIGRELRPLDLHTFGSTIELVDLAEAEVISGEVADLPNRRLMRAAHSRMITDRTWMEGFARHMLDRLAYQAHVLEHAEPLKALWVAKDQRQARVAVEIINQAANSDFARLVISDEPRALRTLERAVRDDSPCCIVAVEMISEGFDCPQLSTIAYAHNITAELYITQMVARAMRVTRTERERGRLLPAQILIPDVPDLREAFIDVLVAKLHMLEILDEETDIGDGGTEGGFRLPRYDLTAVSAPRADDVVVVGAHHGSVPQPEVMAMEQILQGLGLGEGEAAVFAPRAVIAARRFTDQRILIDRIPTDVTIGPANPRDLNIVLRDHLQVCAGWWTHRGDTPVLHFQADANRAVGMEAGGRDNATPQQLMGIRHYMHARIRDLCERRAIKSPTFLNEETN